MKAAESREGKRSLSSCDDDESAAKRNKKQYPKITGKNDAFCWTCHRPGNGNVGIATCSDCPRAYHLKCGHLDKIPEPSEKWVCPECDTVQRADKQAPSSPAHKSTISKLLGFVLERVKRVDGVDNFSAPVDTNKWDDYLDYVVQPMDLPKLKSNIDCHKYRSVESFLADFRWLVHSSYVYNSVHSVYTKIAKSMMNIAKQECEEVKNCSECYMHACTLGDTWFIEPCTTPHVLVWAQLSGFPYWPAKVMRQLSGDVVDVRFFGDHTRANVPAASCFLYSRVMPCSVKSKKHSSKITNGIEEAEIYVKNLKSVYNSFCYAQYRIPYLPKEEDCMRKLQLPEFPVDGETPEFLAKVETMRKEKMIEDKEFHTEMKKMINEHEKSKRTSAPLKRKSLDKGSKLLEMKRKLVKIDTPPGQKSLVIMNMSGSESDSSPKHRPKLSETSVSPEINGVHNSSKTPTKVDDEAIKQVLARSPDEMTALCEKISPKSLSPQSDSGIFESLSRKLFTPPKEALVNGNDKSGLAQRLSYPTREISLESDSDSDALIIAEEPPAKIKKNKPPKDTQSLKRRSPRIDLQLGPRILVRKSYISKNSLAGRYTGESTRSNKTLPALPAARGNANLPISERNTVIVHKALPPTLSQTFVPKRTRRSLIEAMKKDKPNFESPESTNKSKEATKPETYEPAESHTVLSAITSRTNDHIILPSEEDKSKSVPASKKPRRLSNEPKIDCEPSQLSTNPSRVEQAMSITLATKESKRSSDELPTATPLEIQMRSAQNTTDPSSSEICIAKEDNSDVSSGRQAPRRLKEYNVLSTDAPHEAGDEIDPSATNKLSTNDVPSSAVEEHPVEISKLKPRRALMEKPRLRSASRENCEPSTDDSRETNAEPLVNSNNGLLASSVSKDSENCSSGTRTVSSESTVLLSPEKSAGDGCNLQGAEESKERIEDQVIQPEDGKLKDTQAPFPKNADSDEGAPNEPEHVLLATPVKSVICHSAGDSPQSGAVASTPEGSTLKAVCQVPASMEVPVIKVVRVQRENRTKLSDESSKSVAPGVDVEESSSALNDLPAEETANQVDASGVTCSASDSKVVLVTNDGARVHGLVSISLGDEKTKRSPQKISESRTDLDSAKSTIDGLSEMEVVSCKEPKNLPSLDMLDGDLSHLYDELEPAEDDDEFDEPMVSRATLKDEVATLKDTGASSKSVERQNETQPSPEKSQGQQMSEGAESTMDYDDGPEESEPSQVKIVDTVTDKNISLKDSSVERALTDLSTESRDETKSVEETQPVAGPSPETEKIVAETSSPEPATESPSGTEAEHPKTPEEAELKNSLPPDDALPSTPDEAAKPVSSHTPDKKGQCTCIMCHVAHPGASFEKTVEDYQIMKSFELVDQKRGLTTETEEFLKRLRDTSSCVASLEESDSEEGSRPGCTDGLSRNSRKSVNITLVPRNSTNVETGPSTSAGKQPRPPPGLVILSKDAAKRRWSSELKSQSENSLGGLQISSSMSLNPSAMEQMSSKSPADRCAADARRTPAETDTAGPASEKGGSEAKKAVQNATTMPLPIIIKVDPDANEVPEVPKPPPKPTIKLKQMSSLLERPPPPPSPKKFEPTNRNECTTPKFNMVPPFEPKKTLADVRKLIEIKSQFISAKLKKDIYTLFDQIQHDYDSHMELLQHIADASLNTVENTLESNKNLVFEEMKGRLRQQVDAHIAEVKKKQWCILCGNEAAFHCCWGYNYCCEDCQKTDWAEHTKVCTQYNMTASDPYIRASPRFKALLEKQMLSGGNKKILVQDLIDSPVAVSVQSSPPGKAKATPYKGRKILAGPRTSFLESDLSASLDASAISAFSIPAVAKTSAASTPSIQRISDQGTSYKLVQPSRTVRIINPPRQRLAQVAQKPQIASKPVPRAVVSSPSSDLSQSGKIAARLTTLGKWGSVKISPSIEVSRTPITSSSGVQRKPGVTAGRIVPQNSEAASFLRVMDDKEIASILQRDLFREF